MKAPTRQAAPETASAVPKLPLVLMRYPVIIGPRKTLNDLSNTFKDNGDFGNALSQDFKNALVGIIVLGTISAVFACLIFG